MASEEGHIRKLSKLFSLLRMSKYSATSFMKSHEIQSLLASNLKFDLVIAETAFNDFALGA
jgi:hypothetical protein